MKKIINTVTSTITLVFCIYSSAHAAESNAKNTQWSFLPNIVATYNNNTITKKEFIDEINYIMPTGVDELPKEDLKPLAINIINKMIDESILLKYAEEDGIKPQKDIVKKEFQAFLKSLTKQEYDAFIQSLKTQKTTLEAYEKNLCNNEEAQIGLTVHKWAEDEFKKQITVTEAEVKKYYEANKARFKHDYVNVSHILVEAKDDSKESLVAAKKQADVLYDKMIAKTADFKQLAEEVSHCKSGKETAGFLGPIAPGDLKKDFKHLEKIIFNMKDDEISKPQKSPKGYHIIKVEHSGHETLENVTPYIKSILINQKQQDKIAELIKNERKNMKIKFNF